jgi:hypothetical protein
MSFDRFIERRLGIKKLDEDKWEMNYVHPLLGGLGLFGLRKFHIKYIISSKQKNLIKESFQNFIMTCSFPGGILGFSINKLFQYEFSYLLFFLALVPMLFCIILSILYHKNIKHIINR